MNTNFIILIGTLAAAILGAEVAYFKTNWPRKLIYVIATVIYLATLTVLASLPNLLLPLEDEHPLSILSKESDQGIYLIHGSGFEELSIGDTLVVYNEIIDGIEIGVALLRVVAINPDTVSAQVVLKHSGHSISPGLRVDNLVDNLNHSQLIPASNEFVGYFLSEERVRLSTEVGIKENSILEALKPQIIDETIVDYLAFDPPIKMRVTSLGSNDIIAQVELIDNGNWPEPGTVLILSDNKDTSAATDTSVPTATNIPISTPTDTSTPTATDTSISTPTNTSTPNPSATNTPTLTIIPIPIPDTPTQPAPTLTSTAPPPPTATKITSLPQGTFKLLKPDSLDEPTYGLTEFEWQWNGLLTENQGFEVRVWRDGEPPAGVHDSVLSNNELACQPGPCVETLGDNTYRLKTDISNVAGVLNRGGEYNWTVVLVQIEPEYKDLGIKATPPGLLRFELPGGGGGDGGGGGSKGSGGLPFPQ